MHLNCPNCQAELEVIPEESVAFLTCSTCGSRINPSTLIDVEETASFVPQPKRMIDEYELLELIGRGTFGEVWKARDTLLKTLVAIKLPREHNFHTDSQELFLREARTMATLKHPHIVRVLRVIDRPDLTAIVMDYVPGTSLSERLKNFPFEDPRAAAAFWEVVARAVDFANEAGVVHRDLKTANILLNEKLEPLVTDFGLAKDNSAEFTVTEQNAVVGNYAHMSPEQAAGRSRDATRRSDVYSLGSILYQLLAHRFPFMGEGSTMSHLKQTADPKPPSAFRKGIPRDLDTICLKALRRDPQERYASAVELADDLRRWLDGRPIQARPTPAWERAWRWTQRNRALSGMGVLVAAVVVMAALAIYWMMPDDGRMRVSIPIYQRNADANGKLEPIPDVGKGRVPKEATVHFWLRHPTTGVMSSETPTATTSIDRKGMANVRLPAGRYRVVAELPGHGFHEVERTVPATTKARTGAYRHLRWKVVANNGIQLPSVDVPLTEVVIRDMVFVEGNANVPIGLEGSSTEPLHSRTIPPFFMDANETTVRQWNELISIRGKRLPEESVSQVVTGITLDAAITYAKNIGKRLPSEFEYEFAATNGGKTRYPWGNSLENLPSLDWDLSTLSVDKNEHGVTGLFSGVAEFTSSWFSPYPPARQAGIDEDLFKQSLFVIRGGDSRIISGTPTTFRRDFTPARRFAIEPFRQSSGIGFRCARSANMPHIP